MQYLKKILAGDDVRPSRAHTEAGEFCGLDAIAGLPSSALTWTQARFGGRAAKLPWWVWGAIRFVGLQLRRADRVLEAGAGFSTLWLAVRCAAIVSIEESGYWRDHIADQAQAGGVRNLQLQDGPSYPAFCVLFPAVRWDVVVIDAPADRLRMFVEVMDAPHWQLPRVIVVDDTDRPENRPALGAAPGYQVHTFKGFKPQTLHACETSVFVREGG